jgi:hypothetical protein
MTSDFPAVKLRMVNETVRSSFSEKQFILQGSFSRLILDESEGDRSKFSQGYFHLPWPNRFFTRQK